MTLIELLFFLLSVVIGIFIAGILLPIGGLWLAIVGFVAGFLLIPGVFFAYEKYRQWAYCGNERMPACSCGSSEFRAEFISDNEFHEVCQLCSRRYDKFRDKVYVIEDGSRKPYMHLVKHRGWIEMDSADG